MEQIDRMVCPVCKREFIIGYPIGTGKKQKIYCKKDYEVKKGIRDERGFLKP